MGTKCKKILEEIHPLTLIREVQKWPLLYEKDNPDRTNHHFRLKVWHVIGKALFMDWDTFTDWEKESKVTELMKKWRNLRDTFKRQVETEKKIREGHDIKKKTYVYFKHMLYLLPHIASPADEESDPAVEPKLNEYFKRSAKRGTPVKQHDKNAKRKKRPEIQYMPIKSVNIPVTPSKSTDDEELIDEDKHFLMSLVPSFKRMNDDEKLEAKVEILKVIKGINKGKNTQGNANSVDEYNSQLVDSLPYNIEDTEVIKIEMITDDLNCESQSNGSESDSENTD